MSFKRFCGLTAALVCALLAVVTPARAQSFAALISPPRFELAVKPGETTRQVFEIDHTGNTAGRYKLYTADWTLAPDNSVRFFDALQPDSCRPWVAIERREVTIAPKNKLRFRFEITPPAGTPAGECRFAIMVEGQEQSVETRGNVTFPVSGRIGVIVYATLGDAAPKLAVTETKLTQVNGKQVPTLMVHNSGNAHGRLSGFLSGTDAAGTKLEFTPSTLPILPGETRAIPLTPALEGGDTAATVAYPVTVKGTLEWAGQRQSFEQRFAP